VAQGFNQRKNIDYNQTYAPVVSFSVVRLLLALSAKFGWVTRHIDVKNAYLNGYFEEEIYMKLPPLQDNQEGKIVRLLRPIYGLKQSGKNWNDALDSVLTKKGFKRLQSSNCVYRKGFCTYLVIYVDNILIFSRYEKEADEII